MSGSSNGTYLTYNNLCDMVKSIVTQYWDDYYKIKKSYKQEIEKKKYEIKQKKDEIEQLKKTIEDFPKSFAFEKDSDDMEKVGEKVNVDEQKEDEEAVLNPRGRGRRKNLDAPEYQKYFTLLKQKSPEHSVRQRMEWDGVPSGIIKEIILKNEELRQEEVQPEEKEGEGLGLESLESVDQSKNIKKVNYLQGEGEGEVEIGEGEIGEGEWRMKRGGGKGQGKGEVEIGQGKEEGEGEVEIGQGQKDILTQKAKKEEEVEDKKRQEHDLEHEAKGLIDDYEKYLFVKFFSETSNDIIPLFGQGDFTTNTVIVEKLEKFEHKIMHIKISNYEKMKLFLCALCDNGYCIESLKMLFEKVIFPNAIGSDLDNLRFIDKQIQSIYNDYRSKKFIYDTKDHNYDLKKNYSLCIFILHNCIL